MLRLLADPNIPFVEPLFSRFGELRLLPGRRWRPADVRNCDALLVRSVTRVDAALLAGSNVRFVATATAGTEHLDLPWLAAQGITVADAAGSNAVAVAEYVLSAMAVHAGLAGRPLTGLSLGIIGCGNVGSALAARAAALGLRVCRNDPPLAATDPALAPHSLAEALACDVVSVHVPLNGSGPHPTAGLIDADAIAALRPGACLVNAARGTVVDEQALKARLAAGPPLDVVVDCWAGEPAIDADLLRAVAIGTPHIAGYSLDARARGTAMIYRALARWQGLDCEWPAANLDHLLPVPAPLAAAGRSDDERLQQLILDCYDVRRDAVALWPGQGLPEPDRGALFDRLRRHYPPRREFAARVLLGRTAPALLGRQAQALGIGSSH